MDGKLRCWERDERCGDCPVDHPENKCSEFLKETVFLKQKELTDGQISHK